MLSVGPIQGLLEPDLEKAEILLPVEILFEFLLV